MLTIAGDYYGGDVTYNGSDGVDDYTRTSARIKSMREEIKTLKLRLAKLGMDEDQLIASGNLRNVEIVQPGHDQF